MKILAALIFFTRLPFWRIKEIPAAYFKQVVNYWPLVGWLTGGLMAGVLWLSTFLFPLPVGILLAILCRLLITGALHEDGLADFLDGFGGGTTRERTLAIMKDSHIGTYGVIGLVVYYLLVWSLLGTLSVPLLYGIMIAGDTWSKFVAGQLINVLPYARKEEDSKAKNVYNRMGLPSFLFALACGALPLFVFLPMVFWLAAMLPLLVFLLLYYLMQKRLQGYTGDCCGATFLLCELSFYFGVVIIAHWIKI